MLVFNDLDGDKILLTDDSSSETYSYTQKQLFHLMQMQEVDGLYIDDETGSIMTYDGLVVADVDSKEEAEEDNAPAKEEIKFDASYENELRKRVVPILQTKISECKSPNISNAIESLTQVYCYEAGIERDDCTDVFGIMNRFLSESSSPDIVTKVMALFVLASIYYLGYLNSLTETEVCIEGSTKLGFDGSVDMFASSVLDCGFVTELGATDLKGEVQSKLGVELNDCDIDEYFEQKIYLTDLDTVKQVAQIDMSMSKKMLFDLASGDISRRVSGVLATYRDLFSSSYQVVKPEGLLVSDGILTIKGNKAVVTPSIEAMDLYEYFAAKLGIQEARGRIFDANMIMHNYKSGVQNRLYFSGKLLEFLMGRTSYKGTDKDYYSPASTIASWDKYAEKHVEPQIRSLFKVFVWSLYKEHGYSGEDPRVIKGIYEEIKPVLDYLARNLTPCMIVITWRTTSTKHGKEMAGFKLRMSDTERLLPLDTSITENLVQRFFNGMYGKESAVCEPIVPIGDIYSYNVIDIQHKFDPDLVNGTPLFAYRALDSLLNSGQTPSWDNLILGKLDNDSILTVGSKSKINFASCFKHWIMAGSRSGKGVMTLNLLAAAIASRRPIFYLDNKPDMASLFMSDMLSGGKMFCINGDYDSSFDEYFGYPCNPDKRDWLSRVPSYIQQDWGTEYLTYAPIFYLRAVMFMFGLVYVRSMVKDDQELYAKLGGEDGVVYVIDEITAATRAIESRFRKDGIIGRLYYSSTTLSKARESLSKGKPMTLTQVGCYNTDLIRSLNDSISTLLQFQQKGLVGGKSEGGISDVFILGQEFFPADRNKTTYNATTNDNVNGTDGNVFYNFLFSLGTNDAFMGYNNLHEEYMYSGERTSKSYTRLNGSARNFAHIKNFTVGTLNTMLDGKDSGVSSKTLANEAMYFKPFLIFNSGEENSPYVSKEFKSMCDNAKLDFEQIKNENRLEDGRLNPAMGFIPYIEKQGGVDVKDVLAKSYDIANYVVKAFNPNYDGDCIDFIYDLRPEAMFTAVSLASAVKKGSHDTVCKLMDEFFGNSSQEMIDPDEFGEEGLDTSDFNSYLTEPFEEEPNSMESGNIEGRDDFGEPSTEGFDSSTGSDDIYSDDWAKEGSTLNADDGWDDFGDTTDTPQANQQPVQQTFEHPVQPTYKSAQPMQQAQGYSDADVDHVIDNINTLRFTQEQRMRIAVALVRRALGSIKGELSKLSNEDYNYIFDTEVNRAVLELQERGY